MLLEQEDVIVTKITNIEGFTEASNRNFTVLLDTNLTDDLKREGIVRDFIRIVQEMRKKRDLPVEKRIELFIHGSKTITNWLKEFDSLLHNSIVLQTIHYKEINDMEKISLGEEEIFIQIK